MINLNCIVYDNKDWYAQYSCTEDKFSFIYRQADRKTRTEVERDTRQDNSNICRYDCPLSRLSGGSLGVGSAHTVTRPLLTPAVRILTLSSLYLILTLTVAILCHSCTYYSQKNKLHH